MQRETVSVLRDLAHFDIGHILCAAMCRSRASGLFASKVRIAKGRPLIRATMYKIATAMAVDTINTTAINIPTRVSTKNRIERKIWLNVFIIVYDTF